MHTRLWLAAVTVFWLVMSAWLWLSEFGERRQPGSIPPSIIWQKILTAPDPSNLEIRFQTNVIGYCRWRPDVGQELATGTRRPDDEPVEGLVQQLAYYSLDFEGSLTLPDFPARTGFSLLLRLDTNRNWQIFSGRLSMRPDVYELSANAAAQTAHLRVDAGADQLNRTFRFTEFQNPQKLLQELGGPMLPMMAAALGVPLSTNQLSAASLGLRWEARHDSVLVGGNRVRAYRLQTKLVNRYKVTLFISPVGELLRAELPYNLVLVHDSLAALRDAAP